MSHDDLDRHERIVAPLRRTSAIVLRLHVAMQAIASRCLRFCPAPAFVALIAAECSSNFIWRAGCYTIAAILAFLVFAPMGFSFALTALLIDRPNKWYERVALLFGILGGIGLVAIGCLGAWGILRMLVT